MSTSPDFQMLTPQECLRLLRRNQVGRIAFQSGEHVDIQPIGYVARGNWIFLRSAWGTKLAALAHRPYVAFETDEVEGPFDWRSVVVQGTVYMLPVDGSLPEQRAFRRAVAAMRDVLPETLTELDPVPERAYVYGIHINEIAGRSASTGRRPRRRVRTRRR